MYRRLKLRRARSTTTRNTIKKGISSSGRDQIHSLYMKQSRTASAHQATGLNAMIFWPISGRELSWNRMPESQKNGMDSVLMRLAKSLETAPSGESMIDHAVQKTNMMIMTSGSCRM